MTNKNESVVSVFGNTINIVVYHNGNKHLFFKGDDKFEKIYKSLIETTNLSHDMPAFGVSLHDETNNELKTGTWVELVFEFENSFNDMPFDTLLFKVEAENSGFNLIRKFNGKYEGRCFYLSLADNMSKLQKTIDSVLNDWVKM